MNRRAFEQLVVQAVASLPPFFQEKLENVEIVVADWPTEEQLETAGVPPGETLFGLYEGTPLTERTTHYGLVLPDKITIFQGPLEEWCQSPDEIRAEVRATVIHELAHFFGISDERLRELGVT